MLLPKVIASSVVRSAQQGESHGGVYLVDLESGEFEQKIDWNDASISWEGRGSDRGLRGIAFYGGDILLAASDEIFVYDAEFRRVGSFKNRYLKHCHEIHVADGALHLTSTGFNSVLQFDLRAQRFTTGHEIVVTETASWWERLLRRAPRRTIAAREFAANTGDGPAPNGSLHINNVSVHDGAIMVSGTRTDALFAIRDGTITQFAPLPRGTHNAQAFHDGIIYNDTASDRIAIACCSSNTTFAVPHYAPEELTHTDIPNDHARQGFARGLCFYGDDLLIGGSSPSTISVYRISTGERIKSVNLSQDIRNCIHGLEVWPF